MSDLSNNNENPDIVATKTLNQFSENMQQYLSIINKRLDDLIKITINERKANGLGILFLDFSDKTKMDCRYASLSNEEFPQIVRERYYERITSLPNSIIFFLIYDGQEELLYEVDLDKNSTFYKQQ